MGLEKNWNLLRLLTRCGWWETEGLGDFGNPSVFLKVREPDSDWNSPGTLPNPVLCHRM